MPNINQVTNNNDETKGFGNDPINRFTLKQWIKHPTTILLMIVSFIAYTVIGVWVNSQLKEVNYLKERIVVLENREAEHVQEMQNYIRALMFKETQLKEQKLAIDSLKTDIQ